MNYLNLIRYKNLFIIAFTQIVIKFVLFPTFDIFTTLNTIQFTCLVIATLCIAAGGYVINDINDVIADGINKPNKLIVTKKISLNTANNLYMALTIIGVCFGLYVSNSIDKNAFLAVFILVAGLLYSYATNLKNIPILGNIIISLLVGLSILIVGVFDLTPAITLENKDFQKQMMSLLLDYAIFAFFINLIRELVKDCEDIDGDYKQGVNTLPIAFGIKRTALVSFGLVVITIMSVIYYNYIYFYKYTYVLAYFVFLVIAPLLYCAIQLISAKHKKEFSRISLVLKITLFTGVCSMFLFKYILENA
ncbi:geranylgeranylglycerol-phosphate geranylgeranyltransferase [Aurantibacter sp.]|uniref:geranylgeranylglycerol-phosphate geranylgeranyltransferase n=1 Tax=Aurantibacter sp. TaxID=2807103 RepID=UPI0035C7F439